MSATVIESANVQSASLRTQPIFTIDELIRRRAQELEDAPLIGYPKEDIVDYEEHSARNVDQYVDAAVAKFRQWGLSPVDSDKLQKLPVVGILAQSSLNIIITIIALNRLGYSSFLISTRLASPALLHLLKAADCSIVMTTPNFSSLFGEIEASLPVKLLPILQHSDYYHVPAQEFYRSYTPSLELPKIAVVIHSSGSTGLPKPIWLSNKSCIASFATNLNMRALICSPLFHSHGFYETFRSIYSGKPIYYCNYSLPLTRQGLIKMIEVVRPELFHCVPYIVKLLAETNEGIASLIPIKLVLFGGSACPDDLGDRLVDAGVILAANYGATETGRLMTSGRPEGDKAWNYLRLLPVAKPYVLFDEITPGIYECVALDGLASKSTINSDDPPRSFRTRDLFTPHPDRSGLWKYVCRMDDRFTLINGENVLPLLIEGRIRQEEIVKEACVFGEGKSFPGVLVVKADRASHLSDSDFLEQVWPAVESANSRAETFSRIPKELVVVLPAETQYPRTDKGTFIRVPMYRQFARKIEAAYSNFEATNEKSGTLVLNILELEEWLLKVMKEQLRTELDTEADFFAAGIDSLQCIKIWYLLKSELDLGGRQGQLGQNILYETSNVKQLALHLYNLRLGQVDAADDQIQKMHDLITKYSDFSNSTNHVGSAKDELRKEVVLVTGATGGLGSHLVAQLASQSHVSKVWALVRAPSEEAAANRVSASLSSRGIQLPVEASQKIISLPADFSRPDLGLSLEKFLQLHKTVTCIIHSAWAVNFNIPVQSFEAHHISGVHNLINVGLQSSFSPTRFFFCSSVSAAGGSPRPGFVQEGPVPKPEFAQKTGYARSKFVAEHITHNAMISTGITSRVLRIGQLIGDTRVGEWNTTEGIPMMIQTAQTLGCLPALDEEMTWLPVDLAATAILELTGIISPAVDRPEDKDLAYHVLNPTRFHWARDMLPALATAGLNFEVLPTSEWMDRLRESERNPVKNPPIKLLEWFEGKYGSGVKVEPLVYQTGETVKDSRTLGQLPNVLDEAYMRNIVDRLRMHWSARKNDELREP